MEPADTEPTQSPRRRSARVARVEEAPVEQLMSWARLGLHVERGLASVPRVVDVAAGRGQFAELAPAERMLAHALIDSRIADRVEAVEFGSHGTPGGP